jgi:hypothetical protein
MKGVTPWVSLISLTMVEGAKTEIGELFAIHYIYPSAEMVRIDAPEQTGASETVFWTTNDRALTQEAENA